MTTLERYVSANFLGAATLVLLVLVALFSFLSLVEELDEVGEGLFTTMDAVRVVVLTMPKRVLDLVPVTAMLGAMLGLGAMANHRELTAIRAAGVSRWQLAGALTQVAAVMVVAVVLTHHFIVPPAERQAAELRVRSLAQSAGGADTGFWTRTENRFVHVARVDHGRIPRDIEIYELSTGGRLKRFIRAESATIDDADRWVLHGVRESRLLETRVEHTTSVTHAWESFLSPRQMRAFIAPAETLSVIDLYRYIQKMEGTGINTHRYQTVFWQQISLPFGIVGMTLLSLPFLLGSVRVRSAGFRIVIGSAAGVVFYLLEQISGQAALIFDIAPAPAALAPEMLLLAIALVGIKRLT
jgi:lipopolysaccharide export system permease protein